MRESPADDPQVLVRAALANDRMLQVSVRDQGTGLSPDSIRKLFEPFFTTKQNGLGMGLSISRSIIEAHGGQIWAQNSPDGGATFSFTIPLEHPDRKSAVHAPESTPATH